jgi:hypothetical protein
MITNVSEEPTTFIFRTKVRKPRVEKEQYGCRERDDFRAWRQDVLPKH